jgi:transcriptional regulator with XRE-family HTH domain
MSTIGKEIRKARIDKGLLQKTLADRLGVPQQYISRVESDKVDLRLSTLQRIADELGVGVCALLQGVEHIDSAPPNGPWEKAPSRPRRRQGAGAAQS